MKVRRRVVVSLRSLERWLDSLPGLAALPRCFTSISAALDGFKIQYGHSDIMALGNGTDGSRLIPGWWSHVSARVFQAVSVSPVILGELESLRHLSPQSIRAFARGLNHLALSTGIVDFSVDGAGVSLERWSSLLNSITPTVRITVQNSSPGSREFSELEDVSALLEAVPQLSCSLNTFHLLQSGYRLDDPAVLNFVDNYRERITCIHASSPGKKVAFDSTPALCSGNIDSALFTLLSTLAPDTVVVIDGDCPAMRDDLLIHEIEMLRLLTMAQRKVA
jgi:hypothetical protein